MKITISNGTVIETETLVIELDNRNRVHIIEDSSGSILLENIGFEGHDGTPLGFALYTIGYSAIDITPEG